MKSGGDEGGDVTGCAAFLSVSRNVLMSVNEPGSSVNWTCCSSHMTKSRSASSSNWLGGARRSSSLKSSARREAAVALSSLRQGSPGMGTLSVSQAR